MLPPGQKALDGFPRFGTHAHQPPPEVPDDPVLEIGGAVTEPATVRLADLAGMPRTQIDADFHCVAGWSATGLRWEGVPFAHFYREVLEPIAAPGVTHVVFGALDGFWSFMALEDALADDVLIAEHLDGRPLDGDHGAPARLVCPAHYGFVNAKHLCRIELRTQEPPEGFGTATRLASVALKATWFKRHPRARVWHEERHRHIPGRVFRPLARLFVKPTMLLSGRGRR